MALFRCVSCGGRIPLDRVCHRCYGGRDRSLREVAPTCETCDGEGRLHEWFPGLATVHCPSCGGSGIRLCEPSIATAAFESFRQRAGELLRQCVEEQKRSVVSEPEPEPSEAETRRRELRDPIDRELEHAAGGLADLRRRTVDHAWSSSLVLLDLIEMRLGEARRLVEELRERHGEAEFDPVDRRLVSGQRGHR